MIGALAAWLHAHGAVPPLVTALPATAYNGQYIAYQADATNGIVWLLRYNADSASSYKWEAVNASALYAEVATDETTTSATYVDLTTPGPSVTLPLGGDYDVLFGAGSRETVANNDAFAAVKRGAAATNDADCIQHTAGASGGELVSGSRLRRMTGMTAGEVLKLQYRCDGTGTAEFINRWISARPIRVG